MTLTEEEQTVVNVTPVTTSPVAIQPSATTPNIKRNLPLYQYSLTAATKIQPLRRLLGKKCWKEVKAIVYDDSTLKVFEDAKLRDPVFEIKLETVALYLAFGKAANKYGPPPITEEEVNYIAPHNFFAIPETKDREKIHWFAAKDEQNLKDLIQAIAESVDGKVNPPQLGKGAKYRYSPEDADSKWKTYWTTQMTQAQTETEENGAENKFVATPLVAVLEQQKEKEKEKATSPPTTAKNGSAKKSKPTPQPRQQRDYYHVDFEVPEKVDTLNRQAGDGLFDENLDQDKTIVVRLVHGKRVKEIVTVQKKQEPEAAPAPPDYPPPPIPTLVLEENKQGEPKHGQVSPKIETVTLVKDEQPLIISTKCIQIESARPPSDPGSKEQIIEVSQHNAVINIASVEHTVSKSSEFVVKETSTTYQETTATNGSPVVH